MRICRFLSFGLVFVLMSSLSLKAHEEESHIDAGASKLTEQQQEIIAVLESYAKAMESAEIDAVESITTSDPNFSYLEGTFLDVGWQSYKEHLAPEISIFRDPRYRISKVRPVVLGDVAYATYGYAFDVTIVSNQFESGEHPVSMRGMATAIFVKKTDGWKIQHMHTVQEKSKKVETDDH